MVQTIATSERNREARQSSVKDCIAEIGVYGSRVIELLLESAHQRVVTQKEGYVALNVMGVFECAGHRSSVSGSVRISVCSGAPWPLSRTLRGAGQ